MIRVALLGLVLLVPSPRLGAQETVRVHRLADTVSIRQPDGSERALYYFDPVHALAVGGQVEQGSSAHTQVLLSGGGLLEVQSNAHFVIDSLGADGDVIRFEQVTLAKIRASTRALRIVLPGGTVTCDIDNSEIRIQRVPGRYEVRNQGHRPVGMTANLVAMREVGGEFEEGAGGLGAATLDVGEEIRLPDIRLDHPVRGDLLEAWGVVLVRHGAEVETLIDEGALKLRRSPSVDGDAEDITDLYPRPASEQAALSVGGVRTQVPAGQVLVIHNQRPDVPRPTAPPSPVLLASPSAAEDAAMLPPLDAPPAVSDPAPSDGSTDDGGTDDGGTDDDGTDDGGGDTSDGEALSPASPNTP